MAMVVIAASCNVAWADGDPASDVLLSQLPFLPADAGFSSAGHARLEGLLISAARAGCPLRVAIIPNRYDLGSITVLWRKPQTYARFLGAELSLVYKHPLIVVMPNGLGLNWPGHSIADAQRQLTGLTVNPGPTSLGSASETPKLSAARGDAYESKAALDAACAKLHRAETTNQADRFQLEGERDERWAHYLAAKREAVAIELAQRAAFLQDELGPVPAQPWALAQWTRAAEKLLASRVEQQITDPNELGPVKLTRETLAVVNDVRRTAGLTR
jgi:hypothetical protein